MLNFKDNQNGIVGTEAILVLARKRKAPNI